MMLRTPEVRQTEQFAKWRKSVRDPIAKRAIHVRITRLGMGLLGDCKRIGNISELRIDVGAGYRVYFTKKKNEIILLLVGGDKSSQDKDIKLAQELAKEDVIFSRE